MIVISLSQASHTYSGAITPAVAALDLDISRGELVALVGRSGSGKTTTLKMINRLQEATGGTLVVNDRDVVTTDPVTLRQANHMVDRSTDARTVAEAAAWLMAPDESAARSHRLDQK